MSCRGLFLTEVLRKHVCEDDLRAEGFDDILSLAPADDASARTDRVVVILTARTRRGCFASSSGRVAAGGSLRRRAKASSSSSASSVGGVGGAGGGSSSAVGDGEGCGEGCTARLTGAGGWAGGWASGSGGVFWALPLRGRTAGTRSTEKARALLRASRRAGVPGALLPSVCVAWARRKE